MHVKIWQIDRMVGAERMFESYDRVCERFGPDIEQHIYDMVWEGDLDASDLEMVFAILNTQHPADYKARSLSCSDIVETADGLFYCDIFGFKRVNWKTRGGDAAK